VRAASVVALLGLAAGTARADDKKAAGDLVQKAIAKSHDGDHAGAIAHYQEAADLVRRRPGGADSLELAVLLLNYGQVRAQDNVEAGIGLIGEARSILEHLGDPRAAIAGALLADLYVTGHRYADARKVLEDALAHQGPDAQPDLVATLQFDLAQSLAETGGYAARARKLALDARATLAKLPGASPDIAKKIDAWLAKHP